MPNHKDLRRPRTSRSAKPRILIVCEGKITEPHYLHSIQRQLGHKVILEFDTKHSDPKSIVETAVAAKKIAASKMKRDPNEGFDQIWCVFDRDEHLLVPEALQQAQAKGIPVAFSNPCFELWLLLHFQEQTASLTRDNAARSCKAHMPGFEKHPHPDILLANLQLAEQRAAALCTRQIANERTRENPWTDVHKLIEALRNLSSS